MSIFDSNLKDKSDELRGKLFGSGPRFGAQGASGPANEWLGFRSSATGSNSVSIGETLAVKDSFLNWASLSASDHNKLYTYEFIIAEGDTVRHRLVFPLNPQGIEMSVPNTTQVTVLQSGIMEESNGSPLRTIRLSGTSGILPAETYSNGATVTNSLLTTLLGDTIKTGLNALNQIGKTINALNGSPQSSTGPLNYTADKLYNNETPIIQTGYVFIHNLMRFLDYYMALKKSGDKKAYRLVFQMHKDQMYFDCTLNGYSISKGQGTLEYNYSINLTAWKRRATPVGTRQSPQSRFASTSADKLNILAASMDALKNARVALAEIKNLPDAIRNDRERLENAMYETGVFASELVNAPITMGLLAWKHLSNFTPLAIYNGFVDNQLLEQYNRRQIGLLYLDSPAAPEEMIDAPYNEGNATSEAPRPDSPDPGMDVFNNSDDYQDLLEQMPLDSIVIPQTLRDNLQSEFDRIGRLTATDFRNHREYVEDFLNSMSEFFGGASSTYNRIKGLPSPKKVYRTPSVEDIYFLSQMNDFLIALNLIINLIDGVETNATSYFDFYRDYAISSGFQFSNPTSKFFVPFPYGSTLEQLSVLYLGTADRWVEIAALNGLKAPYIDEEGLETKLLATGVNNSITVPTLDGFFYVGQVIDVLSDTAQKTKRHIKSIDIVNESETILELDGDSDLIKYKYLDNARIKHFKPHTVNSQMLIAIPSQRPANTESNLKTTPGVEDLNGLAQLAGVDFMLQSDGDLVLTSGWDLTLAVGLTNIVQAANIKLNTIQGSLIQHPDFGNPVQAGMSTADVSASDIAKQFDEMFKTDHRFGGINALKVNKTGVAVTTDISVNIANTNNSFAISTQLPL